MLQCALCARPACVVQDGMSLCAECSYFARAIPTELVQNPVGYLFGWRRANIRDMDPELAVAEALTNAAREIRGETLDADA